MVAEISFCAFRYGKRHLRAGTEVNQCPWRRADIYTIEPRCSDMSPFVFFSFPDARWIRLKYLGHALKRGGPSLIFRVAVLRCLHDGRRARHPKLRGRLSCGMENEVTRNNNKALSSGVPRSNFLRTLDLVEERSSLGTL